jgi:hypothetical protein
LGELSESFDWSERPTAGKIEEAAGVGRGDPGQIEGGQTAEVGQALCGDRDALRFV